MGRTFDQELALTALAIRQGLMEYFKGDCVQRMVEHPNLRWSTVNSGGGNHLYERRAREIKNHRKIKLGGLEIMEVYKEPHTAIMYTKSFTRNDEFRKLGEMVESAIRRFLPGIRLEKKGEEYSGDPVNDKELLSSTNIVVGGMAMRSEDTDAMLEQYLNQEQPMVDPPTQEQMTGYAIFNGARPARSAYWADMDSFDLDD